MENIQDYIDDVQNIIEAGEKLKGYWDETGLDMHIAVKRNGMIAVSTKHWGRVHYICTKLSSANIWNEMKLISNEIGRKYIRSTKGPYVYINKLNVDQTQKIFDIMKSHFDGEVVKVWEFSWDINDATLS